MSSQLLISHRRYAKFLLPFAAFSALLLATSIAVAEELSRAEAAALISASLNYPKHEEAVINRRYLIEVELGKKGSSGQAVPGICIGANGVKLTDVQKVLDRLREEGLLTIGEEQVQGTNCVTTFARIELTETGRQYLLEETEGQYTLRAMDIVVAQVTGIVQPKGSASAMAEFKETLANPTPFSVVLGTNLERSHFSSGTMRASFLLYDDGWRVQR